MLHEGENKSNIKQYYNYFSIESQQACSALPTKPMEPLDRRMDKLLQGKVQQRLLV